MVAGKRLPESRRRQTRHKIFRLPAEPVCQLVEGPISAKWPATIAQMHPNLNVFVDAAAAEGLEYADLYRERWSLA